MKVIKKTIIFLIIMITVSISYLFAQEGGYFPLKEGNFWIYSLSTGAMIRNEVVGVDSIDGKQCYVLATSPVTGKIQQKEYYSIDNDSIMLHERLYDDMKVIYNPPQRILKFPLKDGDSWIWQGKIGDQNSTISFLVNGPENIIIKNINIPCYKVTFKIKEQGPAGMTVTIIRWYANGIGLIKEEDKLEKDGKTSTISSVLDYYKVMQEEIPAQ